LDRLKEETAAMLRRIMPGTKAELASALLPIAGTLLASALFLSACNTAEGVGDDVEEAGDEVEDAVD
jgi:predicted small secreted protein